MEKRERTQSDKEKEENWSIESDSKGAGNKVKKQRRN